MIEKYCDHEKILQWLKNIAMIKKYCKWKIEMKNRNENGNENGNVSSIVNEVIRTIFFLRENFISTKSIKRHI